MSRPPVKLRRLLAWIGFGLLLWWLWLFTLGLEMVRDADKFCTNSDFLDGTSAGVDMSLFPPGFACRDRLAGPTRINLRKPYLASAVRKADDYPLPSCGNMIGPDVDWKVDMILDPPPRYPSGQEAARSHLGDLLSANDTLVDLGFDGLDSHVFGLERDDRLLARTTVTRLADDQWIAYNLFKCAELGPAV